MENIIKKAIEGEWIKSPYRFELKEIIRNETAVFRFYMEGGNYKKPFPSDSFYDFHKIVCDPLFWQALGKACGWNSFDPELAIEMKQEGKIVGSNEWVGVACDFHFTNLTQSWDKAVEWLEELVSN